MPLKPTPMLGFICSLFFSTASAFAASTQVIGDNTNYQKAQFTGYMAPFNMRLLHAGESKTETMTVMPASFPAATKFDFSYPTGYQCPGGVWGYLAVDYGNYYGTVAPTPIKSQQVKNITTLKQTHTLSIAGNTAGFNVIFDAFLTKAPNDFSSRIIEIDWQLHPADSTRWWVMGLNKRGIWTDASSQKWAVYTDWAATAPVVMYLLPAIGQDKLSGSIDVKALLNWMVAAKLITGNEYYNGHGLGAEPIQGAGSLTVTSLSIAYQ